ncbi:MAG: PKD domain-containing protein, partial [Bacteroidetes bacterium]|nr:PKD domain-containing protein [Bacteroidota bacterium]
MKKIISLLYIITLTLITGCNEDVTKNINKELPKISFEEDSPIYVAKIGNDIVLAPTIENDENATYKWEIDEKIVGTEKTYTFSSNENGSYFIKLTVTNQYGSSDEEFRVDVANLSIPKITMIVPDGGYKIAVDEKLIFTPNIKYEDKSTFKWSVNNKEVAITKDYTFIATEKGEFNIKITATTEDGEDSFSFVVNVVSNEDLTFSWEFEKTEYSTTPETALIINILNIKNAFDAKYTWLLDDIEKQKGESTTYSFKEEARTKTYKLTVMMKNQYREISQDINIKVVASNDKYFRPITKESKNGWNKVYEYLPAPGQFINENVSLKTMEEACEYAKNRLNDELYVSLGGFGGYIVLGFDHSILNDIDGEGYNFQVMGNSFDGSSEPGIVWVMQDINGNSLPDDMWYELKGSESTNSKTIKNYEVTYTRPDKNSDTPWIDNQTPQNNGVIDYLSAFHTQDYYYPEWVKENEYKLSGTCIPSRTTQNSDSGFYYNESYEWGYADNFSPIDRLTEDINYNAGVNANHFKISNAINSNGDAVNLKYIDFIKVQTGVNVKAGWLGENSTEVFNTKDYNMIKAQTKTNANWLGENSTEIVNAKDYN